MDNKKDTSTPQSYELVNFCEFDKFAEQSYCAIHGVDVSLNLGDITKVDETKIKPFSMICGGSPCQDFSVAGKGEGSKWKCTDCNHEYNPLTVHYSSRHKCPKCGSENLDKSRSSLLVEWLRIIRANKPKWGIYENVKNIVGKKFKETFQMFLNELHEYGYNTYFQVINAKDFGIPQNRERVYLIIILKELDNGMFKFPAPFDSNIRLKDILEDEVDEKYYINTQTAQQLIDNLIESGKLDKEVSNTIRAGGENEWSYNKGMILSAEKILIRPTENEKKIIRLIHRGSGGQQGWIYSTDGLISTIPASTYKDPPKIVIQDKKKRSHNE